MKPNFYLILILTFCNTGYLKAQEISKMKKSELRKKITIISHINDSLKTEISTLQKNKIKLSNDYLGLEKRLQDSIETYKRNILLKDQTITRYNLEYSSLKSRWQENELLLLTKDSIISKLNDSIDEISKLNDSINEISKLNDSINEIYNSMIIDQSKLKIFGPLNLDTTDFLNAYYIKQIPLDNIKLRLVLSKVILNGGDILENDLRYDNEYYRPQEIIQKLPELLNPSDFTYWSVKPKTSVYRDFSNLLVFKSVQYFNSTLPQIEIDKNKLLTLTYNDKLVESFLFNTSIQPMANNLRNVIKIVLRTEKVAENIDIILPIFVIENECYLALTNNQLKRFKVLINSFEYKNGNENKEYYYTSLSSIFKSPWDWNDYSETTGKGIFIFLKDFKFEEANINPDKAIFLFKLK